MANSMYHLEPQNVYVDYTLLFFTVIKIVVTMVTKNCQNVELVGGLCVVGNICAC